MQVTNTTLPGVLIIQPTVFDDERGYLYESYRANQYRSAGINHTFVQDNISLSAKHVLRGLHLQKKHPQGKLIQVLQGEIYDVAIDVNPDSNTFGKYFGLNLNAKSHQQIWIPPGYAHGFCVLSDKALVHYKCTDYHQAKDEAGIAWDCPHINIDWPIAKPILSAKDSLHPNLLDYIRSV